MRCSKGQRPSLPVALQQAQNSGGKICHLNLEAHSLPATGPNLVVFHNHMFGVPLPLGAHSSLLVAREHEDIEDKGGGNGNVVKEESIVDPDGTTVFFTVKRSFILKEEIDPR